MLKKINKNYCVILVLFFTIFALFIEPRIVHAAEIPKVKVMTFNTGPNRGTALQRYNEALVIASFVKEKGLEIVTLQGRDYFSPTDNDEMYFRNAFIEVGYPMYSVQVVEVGNEANIILSKYPFFAGTYSEHNINGGRTRVIQRVAVNSPYGKIWVVNAHTNTSTSCGESFVILDEVTKPTSTVYIPAGENAVIMGDFNVYLDQSGNVTTCEDPTFIPTINTKLTQFKTSCTDSTKCTMRNDPNVLKIIDWMITIQSSQTAMNSMWIDDQIKDQGDGHPVILGLVESPSFTAPPEVPTATPTPTPTPGGSTTLTVTRSRPKIEEMSYFDGGKWDDIMYYAVFALGYLTLIRFGFYIHRFFSFFLLTLVFAAGLGITFAFGLPAGLFVVIMGSFMIMMQ